MYTKERLEKYDMIESKAFSPPRGETLQAQGRVKVRDYNSHLLITGDDLKRFKETRKDRSRIFV